MKAEFQMRLQKPLSGVDLDPKQSVNILINRSKNDK